MQCNDPELEQRTRQTTSSNSAFAKMETPVHKKAGSIMGAHRMLPPCKTIRTIIKMRPGIALILPNTTYVLTTPQGKRGAK